ncbi:recombination-associated protein RdgC [Microbulbifer epialgicus]|uniref:Recombination-associated protein RdgC n=1 Tax=Microbulbifer epialgicus TaxID=393907 RepID=A0ABV4NVA1_9GAMM
MKYTSAQTVSQNTWEPQLKKLRHREIKPSQRESIGFSAVFGYLSPNMMSHEIQNYLFLSLTIEEKKLQKNKLRRAIALKTKEFASKEGKKQEEITKEEHGQIKDFVETEMLKGIAPDEYYINAFIDTQNKLLFVDVSSISKVERLVEWLNRIDSEFIVRPFFDSSLEIYLTSWLYKPTEQMPRSLQMDHEATLKHDNKSKAVFSNQDLESDELITLLNHDKRVMELALVRDGRLKFKLKSDGSIRKLKPTDILKGEIERAENPTSMIQDIEADWIMMTNELTQLYQWFEGIFDVNNPSAPGSDSNNESREEAAHSQITSTKKVEEDSAAELDTLNFS